MADGTVIIQADCNSASSSVTIEGSSLTFAPGPMTLVECEPGSLYSDFLAKLGDVVTYVFDENGNLALNLKMDAGNMIFDREGHGLAELDGTSWTLVGLGSADDLAALVPNTEITLDFKDGQATGFAGCNRYFADYTETAEGILQIGPAASTMMACSEENMQQEIDYLAALAAVESFTLEGETLTIYSGEGVLVFETAHDLALEGQAWVLSGIVQDEAVVSTAIDSKITAEFSGDQVNGFAGCNSYFASYETEGSSLSLGVIGSTMMACDEETNQREAEFLSALQSAAGYEINRNTLTLTDADNNALLIFQAQEDSPE
jgi:heat shock protein HslJ